MHLHSIVPQCFITSTSGSKKFVHCDKSRENTTNLHGQIIAFSHTQCEKSRFRDHTFINLAITHGLCKSGINMVVNDP